MNSDFDLQLMQAAQEYCWSNMSEELKSSIKMNDIKRENLIIKDLSLNASHIKILLYNLQEKYPDSNFDCLTNFLVKHNQANDYHTITVGDLVDVLHDFYTEDL